MIPVSWKRIAWLTALVSLGAAGAIRLTTPSGLMPGELTYVPPDELALAQARAAEEARYPAGFHAREAAVKAELAALTQRHPWAGRYYLGDGLGVNVLISLAPQSGAVATWHGCLGLYAAGYAPILPTDHGTLALKFAPAKEGPGLEFPHEVRPVRWGDRHYLIATDKLAEFANAINSGLEPRGSSSPGFFLLREGDQEKPVVGLPDLPAEYLAWIRTEPTEFRVDKVQTIREEGGKESCDRDVTLRFPRQADDLLKPGMELQLTRPDVYGHATVTRVAETSFEAEFDGYSTSPCKDHQDLPRAGWRFTTGAYAAATPAKSNP